MKMIRAIAVLLYLFLAQATAHAQTDSFWSNEDPIVVGDPYIYWGGGSYTLAPGDSVYNFTVTAVNVNNTNLTYGGNVTWGNGSWSAKTVALPTGNTYVLYAKFYVRKSSGNIYLVGTKISNQVYVP